MIGSFQFPVSGFRFMDPRIWSLLLFLCSTALFAQDDLKDAKIGDLLQNPPIGAEVHLHVSPSLNKAISSYWIDGKETFLLENSVQVKQAARWIGWKQPEDSSLLLIRDGENALHLLIGGEEERTVGDIRDASLFDMNRQLAMVFQTPEGQMLRVNGKDVTGPVDEIRLRSAVREKLTYTTKLRGNLKLIWGERSFDVVGQPRNLTPSPDGSRLAWVEQLSENSIEVIHEGDTIASGTDIYDDPVFSPNGQHVGAVVRTEKTKAEAWVDGEPIPNSIGFSIAVLDDGSPVFIEHLNILDNRTIWRIMVGNQPDGVQRSGDNDGTLAFGTRFFRQGPLIHQVSWPTENGSLITTIDPAGKISDLEIEGKVTSIFASHDGKTVLYTLSSSGGEMVVTPNGQSGPYDRVDFFPVQYSDQVGFIAQRGDRLSLVVGQRNDAISLETFNPPVHIRDEGMTAVVVGTCRVKGKKEIWRRVVELE